MLKQQWHLQMGGKSTNIRPLLHNHANATKAPVNGFHHLFTPTCYGQGVWVRPSKHDASRGPGTLRSTVGSYGTMVWCEDQLDKDAATGSDSYATLTHNSFSIIGPGTLRSTVGSNGTMSQCVSKLAWGCSYREWQAHNLHMHNQINTNAWLDTVSSHNY